MLSELRISNFAIMTEERISFGPGLNVISGESGAGKSIILQALELILGGRPKSGLVREGEGELEIEAVFDLSSTPADVRAELPDCAQGDELLLSRYIKADGKGKVMVNGRLGTVTLLSDIASKIISLCGQSQFIRLLEPKYHLSLVDGFAASAKVLDEYKAAYEKWHELNSKIKSLESAEASKEERREFLAEAVSEIEAVAPSPGLRAELEAEVKKLSNAAGLLQLGQEVRDLISGEDGIDERFRTLGAKIYEITKLDSNFQDKAKLFQSSQLELKEFLSDVEHYLLSFEINEEALASLQERLANLARLQRKFKTDDQGLIAFLENAKSELSLIDSADLVALKKQLAFLENEMTAKAIALSNLRQLSGRKLSKLVEKELSELGMGGVRINVERKEIAPTADGIDAIEFMFAQGKADTFRPLRAIASGGELSRLTLVLKKILKEESGVNVLVFDEVDAGISGGVARAVGEKLKALSKNSQILCITHLPQVASLADKHFLVEKKVGARAEATVSELVGDARVEEIARMLSGHKVTDLARKSAKELIEAA